MRKQTKRFVLLALSEQIDIDDVGPVVERPTADREVHISILHWLNVISQGTRNESPRLQSTKV